MSSLAGMFGMAARYATSYSIDSLLDRPKGRKARIPWTFRAITREWVEAVLCNDIPGAKITSIDFGVGHNGTSGRQQFSIEYNAAGQRAGLPTSVFAKGTPTLTTRISMGSVPSMQLETQFFNSVRPHLDIEAPVGYYSAHDLLSGRSIHLLEDLVATKNATFPNLMTRLDETQARDVVSLLAKFHSTFYQSPRLHSDFAHLRTWPAVYSRMCRLMDLRKYHFKGFDKARPVIPDRLYARRDETWAAIVKSTELHNQLPQTLTHGDVHLGNWYMTGERRMGLLDWQCVSKGHWSRDLAYAMTATMTVEDRRAWHADLIKAYVDELNERSGANISLEEAMLRFRQQIWGALAFWTPTYSPPAFAPKEMQPPELSLEMLKRFTVAIDDHNALEALQA
ncbi:MAG: aminoglycoside phosphotransferase family protein [Parvibaculaceae bacterium]